MASREDIIQHESKKCAQPNRNGIEAKTVGTGIMGGGELTLDKTGEKLQAAQKILAAKSKHLRKIFSPSILISNDVLP